MSCNEARLFFIHKTMFEEVDYEYERVNVTLPIGATTSTTDGSSVAIPQGKVVAIGAVVAGNTENRIIDLSILNNNNEVVKPCDVRFSEKTSGGEFKNSLRPVAFIGGKIFQAKLSALEASATDKITVQVIFMIQKPITN